MQYSGHVVYGTVLLHARYDLRVTAAKPTCACSLTYMYLVHVYMCMYAIDPK